MVQVTVPVVSNTFKASTHRQQQSAIEVEEDVEVITASESNQITELLCAEEKELSDLEIFIAGYRSCAQEILRYLIEDEGLSPQDSIILSIQNHLYRQEQVYIIQYLASTVLLASSSPSSSPLPASPTPPPSEIDSDSEDLNIEI